MHSVHLEDFPVLKHIQVDNDIVAQMDLVRDICNAVFSLRKEANIRVRMPLLKMTICGACVLTKEYLLFANIGDSSGFVFKDGKLFKVTKDYTLVNLLISTGELSPEDAKFHPKKNVLMKALGAVNPAEVDIFDVETDVDGILLSSDGLTNMLNIEQIETVLKSDVSLEEKARKLIMKSNNRGGTDNISVALLECDGD